MKINDLIADFSIYMTNEEKFLYDSLDTPVAISSLNEREQVIINNLIRKSLVSKIRHKNSFVVAKNDK